MGWVIYGLGDNLKDVRVIIRMMLMCDASDIVEYDGSRSKLCNAVINMKYDNNREQEISQSNSHIPTIQNWK